MRWFRRRPKPSPQPVMTVQADGDRLWHLNGVWHREDGPAVEMTDGTRAWYINGFLHRTDGPAIEYPDRRREWYIQGQRHRTDGPAMEFDNGHIMWWLNGQAFTFDQWLSQVADSEEERVALLLRFGQ